VRGYEGWVLDAPVGTECPDCGEPIGPTSELASLLEAISDHEQRCDPDD